MYPPQVRRTLKYRRLVEAFILVGINERDNRYARLLDIRYLEQLFPDGAVSPDNAGNNGIAVLSLFFGQFGTETELAFYLPVGVRIIDR